MVKTVAKYGVLLIFLLTVGAFSLYQDLRIKNSLPYSEHVDEQHRLKDGLRVVKHGDFEPSYYKKSAFISYLTAAGISMGYLLEARKGYIRSTNVLNYSPMNRKYSHPSIMMGAKRLFLAFSIIGLVLACFIGRELTGQRSSLLITLVIILGASSFVSYIGHYINENVQGLFFVMLSYAYIFLRKDDHSVFKVAVVPGILVGLCLASKFTLWPIVVTFLLYYILYKKDVYLNFSVMLLAVVCTFFVVNPYSLINYNQFLADTASEISHYSTGHRRFTIEPGLTHFGAILGYVVRNLGLGSSLLALLGIYSFFKQDWRKALIFMSFPSLLIYFMSGQSVLFPRNYIILLVLVPILSTIGVFFLADHIRHFITRSRNSASDFSKFFKFNPKLDKAVVAGTLILFVLALFPFKATFASYGYYKNDRLRLTEWIIENLEGHPVAILATAKVNGAVLEKSNLDFEKVERSDLINNYKAMVREKREGFFVVPQGRLLDRLLKKIEDNSSISMDIRRFKRAVVVRVKNKEKKF